MEIGGKTGNINNAELLKAIETLKNENSQDNYKPFVENLVKAKFIVPAVIEQNADQNDDEKKKAVKINFRVITDQNKKNFFPCFTDNAVFKAGVKEDGVKKVVLSYDDLSSMVLQSDGKIDGFVINPYTSGMQVRADLLRELEKAKKRAKSNVKKHTIPTNTKVRLRTPKYMPVDMLEKAKEYFAEHQNVKAAYIQMMEKPDADEEYLIAIDFDGDEQDLFDGLLPKIKEYSFGIPIALTDTNNGLGEKVSENTEPFYQKED